MRKKYNIKENIQYLLFGQFVNGTASSSLGNDGTSLLKNTKTTNLRAYKNRMAELENTEEQLKKSRYDIDQFNQIKSVLINLSYNNNGQKTLCVDIVENVMDELRRERKTKMVLNDEEIEQYIEQDLVEVEKMDLKDMTPFQRKIVEEKQLFKAKLCQTISILRLGYMFKVLQAVWPGKASMLGADFFMYKVKKAERQSNKRKGFAIKAVGAKSGMSQIHSTNGSSMENIVGAEKKESDLKEPMLVGVDTFIDGITVKMQDAALKKLKSIEQIYKQNETLQGKDKVVNQLDTIEEGLQNLENNRH